MPFVASFAETQALSMNKDVAASSAKKSTRSRSIHAAASTTSEFGSMSFVQEGADEGMVYSKKAGGLYNKIGASLMPGGSLGNVHFMSQHALSALESIGPFKCFSKYAGGCCRLCPRESEPYMSLLEEAGATSVR